MRERDVPRGTVLDKGAKGVQTHLPRTSDSKRRGDMNFNVVG